MYDKWLIVGVLFHFVFLTSEFPLNFPTILLQPTKMTTKFAAVQSYNTTLYPLYLTVLQPSSAVRVGEH